MPLLNTFNNASRRAFTSPQTTTPPIGNGVMAYTVPASWNGTGTSITSIGSASATMTITGSGTTYVAGPPAYVSVGAGASAIDYDINDVTPSPILSLTQYSTISFWCRMPSTISGEKELTSMCIFGPPFDGIYIKLQTNRYMTFTTNGAAYNYVQSTSGPVFTFNTWQMITYVYTLANNPSTCYVNATNVLTFSHPAGDAMNPGTYGFSMGCQEGRWNQVTVLANTQMTAAQVAAKFTAERGYYGV